MKSVREAEARMRGFLSPRYTEKAAEPIERQAVEWIGYAQNYIRASVVVQADNAVRSPASIYLAGHAVECALKACIRAAGEKSKFVHDLVTLMEKAEEKGYSLHEQQLWCLVRLNWYTFADPETDTVLKGRYPSDQREADPMQPPDAVEVLGICTDLFKQIESRVSVDVDWDLWRIEVLQRSALHAPSPTRTIE